jgi:maleylacetoacetate isomerase
LRSYGESTEQATFKGILKNARDEVLKAPSQEVWMIKLYTSYCSNAAYAVRIGLAVKGLSYESKYIDLDATAGLARDLEYLAINPQGVVPTLIVGQRVYRQSLPILEYLDERYPHPLMLPGDSRDRARIRSVCQVIVSDILPLIEPRVLSYLKGPLGQNEQERRAWHRHWLEQGLKDLEDLMADNPASAVFCHGDMPTIADICLMSLVHGVVRDGGSLSAYPTLNRLYQKYLTIEAFIETAPEKQPDAQPVPTK